MTKFNAAQFEGTEYVTYNGEFVARFKRGGKADFIKFLVKMFTVEEYFAELKAGGLPLVILGKRGYLSPNEKKVLKASGYPQTPEGKRAYLDAQVAKYSA